MSRDGGEAPPSDAALARYAAQARPWIALASGLQTLLVAAVLALEVLATSGSWRARAAYWAMPGTTLAGPESWGPALVGWALTLVVTALGLVPALLLARLALGSTPVDRDGAVTLLRRHRDVWIGFAGWGSLMTVVVAYYLYQAVAVSWVYGLWW